MHGQASGVPKATMTVRVFGADGQLKYQETVDARVTSALWRQPISAFARLLTTRKQ